MTRTCLIMMVACAPAPVQKPPETPAREAAVVQAPTPEGDLFVPDLLDHRVSEVSPTPDTEPFISVGGRRLNALRPVVTPATQTPPRTQLVSTFVRPIDQPTIVTVAYCIDDTGRVASVRGEGASSVVLDTVRKWHFAPYFVDGKPVTACSFVTFNANGDTVISAR